MEVELKDQIFQLEKLSVSFPVLEQVMNLFHKSGSSAPDIAARVSEDPILTARILKLANSEKYGSSGRIFTLNQAFVLVGFPALKNLLMGILLDQLSRAGSREEEQNPDWILHSTLVAAGARFLARKAGYPVPGEAFVAGLLHDLGIQILIQAFPGKYLEIRSTVREQGISYLTAEQKILGTDHAQLGGWLAESWNLPERLIRAILLHHLPDNIRPHESLTILVHLSDAICSYMAESEGFQLQDHLTDEKGVMEQVEYNMPGWGRSFPSLLSEIRSEWKKLYDNRELHSFLSPAVVCG